MKEALIIFIKNPELGKVKTRLASTIGDEKALEIYKLLMKHTREIAQNVAVDRHVFYSQFIDENDEWTNSDFYKHLQNQDPDLGLKMFSSFHDLWKKGYEKVLIIGSDCLELTKDTVKDAFVLLNEQEAVIGPAKDGGYYSIGFNFNLLDQKTEKVMADVFLNKTWSHEDVFTEAMSALNSNNLRRAKLPLLSDVDYEEDLKHLL
ncbi:TIGR04282 family arsenosugar biosynthesis glycosyltransferase [Jiulongibacter sediminis]|uniref:TIGR04282 family arsenosugar biosynthesis glycosyltransferase n=1 Tax=Jiulongibacter sediminis TaxID=1605367 RepID=UPI0026ED0EBC|nr:TIGR04282 family arsenosugar biosynthesis glycosyltransferase [Jiulongibacter sediminis]